MSKLTTFTVYRDSWLRGPMKTSTLLNYEGGKCCMGFLALACGISHQQLIGRRIFSALREPDTSKLPLELRPAESKYASATYESSEAKIIYGINDADISEDEREFQLKERLKALGINVVFKDSE